MKSLLNMDTQYAAVRSMLRMFLKHPLRVLVRNFKIFKSSIYTAIVHFNKTFKMFYYDELLINKDYIEWIKRNEGIACENKKEIESNILNFNYKPLISIVVPVYNPPERYLRLMIDSVQKQIYPFWELCIADDASTDKNIVRIIEEYSCKDKRIKFTVREVNGHISAATNSALSLATGEFIAFVDHDDEIAESALYRVIEELNSFPETDMIYTDEDRISEDGIRYSPFFKPDWNFYMFISINYINHLSVFRKSIIDKIGGLRAGYEGAQDYDLILRFLKHTSPEKIRHISEVLYHWRSIDTSVAKHGIAKMYAFAAAKKAIGDYFRSRNLQFFFPKIFEYVHNKIEFSLPVLEPGVSILIIEPEGSNCHEAVSDIIRHSVYENFEIIVASSNKDNGRNDFSGKVRYHSITNGQYPAIYNEMVKLASNDLICTYHICNRVFSHDWLRQMVSMMQFNDIGCEGARIYTHDDRFFTAGVILGLNHDIYGHISNGIDRMELGYHGMGYILRECSAVTDHCMMFKKDLFITLGGFNTEETGAGYYDIDFCLRLKMSGYKTIWNPYVELKLVSQVGIPAENPIGYDYMMQKWGDLIRKDPFYNRNLSLENNRFEICDPR